MSEEGAKSTSAATAEAVPAKKLLNVLQEKLSRKEFFYSIEVTPSDATLDLTTFDHPPLFVAITWIRDNNLVAFRRSPNACPALQMLQEVREEFPVLSHLTCFNVTSEDLEGILRIGEPESIFALRGDCSGTSAEFKSAANLVAWLRRKLPDATIVVAGYPATHFLATSPDDDLRNLREKVDAGADFIITQITFSAAQLIDFVQRCRGIGITAQILPGVFIPSSFKSLQFVTQLGHIVLPEELWATFKGLKDNDEAFKEKALEVGEKWMREILAECPDEFAGFHIFTWNNLEMVTRLIQRFSTSSPQT
ncbi:methylenetetrahydrofolate reductase (NADPH) isoform X2 [Lutzomyia longipalpis]|uniref:methylenetetrahydrofolate reductase (NADPH) isoform X2 n=1 Tax=Lutzomyia longipalpis TaxID=7200 RepID=UPI0024839F18|nr:methylenetetrahydrofolate reductase (NADPH) isoform X2 [Lutzomyia longipalpis]